MYVTYIPSHIEIGIERKHQNTREKKSKKNTVKRLPSHSKINNRIESTTWKELNVEQKMIILNK